MLTIFSKYKQQLLRSIREYSEVYGALIIVLLIFMYLAIKYHKVEKDGVFIVCKVDQYEADGDGSTTYCTAYLNNQSYHLTSGEGNRRMIGKYYFGKVLQEDPYFLLILYPDREVPNCISKDSFPKAGWLTIPACK